ncbi:MAG: transporter substrate-binding domain-containing protein [Acidimicrobiales bacterium]
MSIASPSPTAVAALAPSGVLRAAINLSNFLLVSNVGDAGIPKGVSPGMAHALAERLGVEIEFLTFDSPGELADAAQSGSWDIGNIGAEPARAEHIAFTNAYAEIECTYLLPAGSPITSFDEVDQPGVRISVKSRAAYALWLERNLAHGELVQTETLDSSLETFVDQKLDALAGLRPRLNSDLKTLPGASILDGSFTAVQQAIGTPRNRDQAGIDFLTDFVEHAKASGLVANLIDTYEVVGLSVAPTKE